MIGLKDARKERNMELFYKRSTRRKREGRQNEEEYLMRTERRRRKTLTTLKRGNETMKTTTKFELTVKYT